MSTVETNDTTPHHSTLLTTADALPRNDTLEIDRYPPNDRLCPTLEIVLPPLNRHLETPAHQALSPKKCNSHQKQSLPRTIPSVNQL